MKNRPLIFKSSWWSFQWRYWRKRTPWDTNVTPPEVEEYLNSARPGRALDLGCGTGTNAIEMVKRGWIVTGIDFIPGAIRKACRKASREHLAVDFRVGDVTDLDLDGEPFDYLLDIGCLHSLDASQQQKYAAGVKQLVRPGGIYMLYAWMPRQWKGKTRGIEKDDVLALFAPLFHSERIEIGEEGGSPTVWYWFKKRSYNLNVSKNQI